MKVPISKTFTVEVRSRKRISRLSSREASGVSCTVPSFASTVEERTPPFMSTTLQSLVHQFSDGVGTERQGESDGSHERRDNDRLITSLPERATRILPDLTAEPMAELPDRNAPQEPKARMAGALPGSPAGAKPKQAVENTPSRITVAPNREAVRLPAANAAPSKSTAERESRSKTGRIPRGSCQRPLARDRSGESFPAGQRWKRRLPKVCW